MELEDFRKMEGVRHRVDEIVHDPATAEKLKPWYRQFCKRPCFHDEYLPTYNRPNVHLIDTDGKGVERLTERGVVANGVEYPVDCLIFATGFEVGTTYTRRAGYDIIGRDGQTLSDKWADGLRTLHGLQSDGFPNCFFLGLHPDRHHGQRAPRAQRAGQARDVHGRRAAARVAATSSRPRPRVCSNGSTRCVRRLAWPSASTRACTPGYYNNEGQLGNPVGFFASTYGAGPIPFFQMLDEWRADGRLDGTVIR